MHELLYIFHAEIFVDIHKHYYKQGIKRSYPSPCALLIRPKIHKFIQNLATGWTVWVQILAG